MDNMDFGTILRELRGQQGIGIKKLAPELGVSYTYLSKLESNQVNPSADLVSRVAAYFHYDYDQMLLAAGKVPPEILSILQDHPDEALGYLRERFGPRHD